MTTHKGQLTQLTLLFHLATTTLLFVCSRLPSFDSSASLVLEPTWLTSLLRWDVFHYAQISRKGYVYEYEYAFFPGTPLVLRLLEKLSQLVGLPVECRLAGTLLGGTFVSTAIAVNAIHTLYDLTIHHFQSPHTALLVSLLSLFSSSPATLRYASCAEPFFTYLSYKGMLYCSKGQFVRASVSFTLAGWFRSNGTMLMGYIAWGILIEPVLCSSSPRRDIFSSKTGRRVLQCLLLSIPPLLPFVWHQYNGYNAFCNVPSDEHRPWCTGRLPLIYSFVQSEYWNVGLFRYWTLQQAPNILLAAPVLTLLIHGSVSHIRAALLPRIGDFMNNFCYNYGNVSKPATNELESDPFLRPSLTPHAIHSLLLGVILLTSSHTQIALRLTSALPFTYWTAARLFLRKQSRGNTIAQAGSSSEPDHSAQNSIPAGKIARWWVCWSMVWGAISLVTWGVFLPPA